MGGYGSGRQYGKPVAEEALRIDIAWMVRTNRAIPGSTVSGSLSWTCRGEPSGNINYTCDMSDPGNAVLELRFSVTRYSTGEKTDHRQRIWLSYTVPNFGGKRWWMHCPSTGERVGKLYCPSGSELFASRKAYRIGYRSQRVTKRDAIFERLFRIQEKLGCERGWGNWITRPKGMHHSTFESYLDEYERLDALCGVEIMRLVGLLKAIEKR
jgi:hypothetical protein